MKSIESNIALYYAFKIFNEPILWGAILITYIMQVSGMSLSQVYIMEACCMIAVTILQVPTGAIADKWGRANSVRIGMCFILLEAIFFASSNNTPMIWIGNIFWAIGFSFVSGADSALLYDSLKVLGREREFKKIAGKSIGWKLGLIAVCMIPCGFLAEINIHLPLYIDIGFISCGLVLSFFFKEPPNSHHSQKGYGEHMIESIKFAFRENRILWIIGFAVLISVTSKLWFFTYNPYFELVKLPLPYYGIVFAVLNAVAALSSYNADAISRRLPENASIRAILGLVTVPILLMGMFVSKWAIPLVFLQNLVRGYLGPFIEHILHDHIESRNRATVMSVKSACHGAMEILAMIGFGYVVARASLSGALTVLGMATIAIGAILVWSYPRVFGKKDRTGKDG